MDVDAVRGIIASAAGTHSGARSGAVVEHVADGRASRALDQSDAVDQLDAENLVAEDRDADGRLGWRVGPLKARANHRRASAAKPDDSDAPGKSLDVTG